MADKLTLEQRHRNMAAIHGKDTKPEMLVRKYLWVHGFRYRLNHKRLPGKPDVVMRKYRTCIFVNGCFWHGHSVRDEEGDLKVCRYFKMPSTNQPFWENKIRRNRERDVQVQQRLAEMGWHSITIWECELKPSVREQTLQSLVYTLNHIFLEDQRCKTLVSHSSSPRSYKEEEAALLMVAEDEAK